SDIAANYFMAIRLYGEKASDLYALCRWSLLRPQNQVFKSPLKQIFLFFNVSTLWVNCFFRFDTPQELL
ncbi:unnamed protein product, partial [Allacma fusca]